jgi:hypothetical protein
VLATASDNCDTDVTVTSTDIIQAGTCTDSYIIQRVYTATDNCGNTNQATQVITIEDTTPPTFTSVPADITAECDAIPPVVLATASDNCDTDVTVTSTDIIQAGTCTDSYIIQRVYTATDNCGNTSQATQVITIEDTTPPTFTSVPADITAECDAIPPVVLATASDNCDTDVTVMSTDIIQAGTCTDSYIIQRVYTATDNCGNTSQATQVITIEDTTPPTFTSVPADIIAECDAIPPVVLATAI